jgi:hypothetical protein
MSASSKTVDHDEIRKWAEARGGRPSIVRTGSGKGKNKGGGVLRIDFGPKEEKFEEISWEEFFEVFDQSHISFLHQDETKDGKASRFSKFVERTGEEDKAAGKQGGAKQFGTAKKAAPTKPAGSKSDSAKSAAAKSSEAKPSPKKSAAKSASAKTGSTAKSLGKTEAKASASKGGAGTTTSKAGQKTSGTKANGGTKTAKKKG